MNGVFVTGTDTGVGKTLVSAWLVRSWRAAYWKPIQTGTDEDRDADTVRSLAPDATIFPGAYEFRAPLSPHEAARLEGARIDPGRIAMPETGGPLVVEGAGGALVPINDDMLMVDLMARLALPVVVVARTGLGTINHSLLTLEALARRGLPVAGVITSGPPNPANRAAIEHHSGTRIVAELGALAGPAALPRHPPCAWTPWS